METEKLDSKIDALKETATKAAKELAHKAAPRISQTPSGKRRRLRPDT
jgi:hypothetical protein